MRIFSLCFLLLACVPETGLAAPSGLTSAQPWCTCLQCAASVAPSGGETANPAHPANRRMEASSEQEGLDSLASVMNQTLADYLGELAQTPGLAIQRLRDDLVTNRADQAFLYYAIAFLHEQMNGPADWAPAEKWYTYAFQLHYTPAYQRLKRRHSQEVLSPVKLARLDKNWQNGATEIPLTLVTPAGDAKTVSIYVLDNMGNAPDPIASEVTRLLDLYGLEVPQQTIDRFNGLYREARQTNASYQALCRQAFLSKP